MIRIESSRPRPAPHVIEKIDRDKVFCGCGTWSYECRDSDKMTKETLENRLLDTHAAHAEAMKQIGL